MPRTVNNQKSKSSPVPHPIPRPVPSPPLSAPIQSGPPSMMDTMKQGFAFGIGSSIARNLFDSKSKPKDENVIVSKNEITNEPKLTTEKMYELYNKCLENNDRNIDFTK